MALFSQRRTRNYDELFPCTINRFMNFVATKSGKHNLLFYPRPISSLEKSRYLLIPRLDCSIYHTVYCTKFSRCIFPGERKSREFDIDCEP